MVSRTGSIINVLVTGVSGGGHGHEIIKTLRLADTPYRIVGTDVSATSLGLFEADKGYVVPPASDPAYIPTFIELCKREDVQVLITGSEPELRAISAFRQRFRDIGVLPLINSESVIDLCMNKWETYRFLRQNGFHAPASVLLEDLSAHTQVQRFPVVVKPAVGGGGSNLTFIAQDREELEFFAKYILKLGGLPMAQEYVGSPRDEYTVGVLTTFDGEFVGSIAVRRDILSGLSNRIKIRTRDQSPGNELLAISSGISQGTIDDYPGVRAECECIALALGSRGPLNFQVRVEAGAVHPFEINPRFSGTTAFRAMAGYNEVDILIRHQLLGERVKKVFYKCGVVVRGLHERFIPLTEIAQATAFQIGDQGSLQSDVGPGSL